MATTVVEDEAVPRADGKLPVAVKVGWGAGGFGEGVMAGGMPSLMMPIYNIALKLDATKLGLISSVPRFADAIYDIWLGHLSDNARTRWGRRRPFIAVGAVLCTVFFVAVWWVPVGWSANGQLAFFAVTSTGYWLSFGTYAIPYNALGFELTGDFNERTSVQAYRFFAIQCSTLVVAGLYKLCFKWPFTGSGLHGVPVEVVGARWVTMAFAGLMLAAGLAPAVFSRERAATARPTPVPLTTALRLTFTDRLFLHFMAMIVVSIFGVTIASQLGLYVTIYHVYAGDKQAAAGLMFVASSLVTAFALCMTLIMPAVSKRLGKKQTILLGQALLILSGATAWWLYDPRHPYWIVGTSLMSTAGMACFQILYGSFLGDICDADELRNGTRREGVYASSATFMNKIIYATQGGLSGALLGWIGYSATQAFPSAHTIVLMRVVFAAAPAVFAVVGVGFAVTFPITAKRAAETRRLLAERQESRSTGGFPVIPIE